MIACMGGWCRSREKCADYHLTAASRIEDRRCPPGQELPDRRSLHQVLQAHLTFKEQAKRVGEPA